MAKKRNIRKWGIIGLLIILLALIAGPLWQWSSSFIEMRKYPAPGTLYKVNGKTMHLYCEGEEGPVVLFDAGWGNHSRIWRPIQEKVSNFARACAYDRAGYGWSEPANNTTRDSETLSDELYALLNAADIQEPVILVAHSIAGFHDRVFAAKYPERTAALILVDASHENDGFYDPERPGFEAQLANLRQCGFQTWTGYRRYQRLTGQIPTPRFYEGDTLDETIALISRNHHCKMLADEFAAFPASAKQAAAVTDLGDIPVYVMAATDKSRPGTPEEKAEANQQWENIQYSLTNLSTESYWIPVRESEHHIHMYQPDLVAETIAKAINRQSLSFPVFLNHAFVVVDSETYRDVENSPFLAKAFGIFEKRTTRTNVNQYTAAYWYGKDTYFEVFDAANVSDPYTLGLGFGVEKEGAAEILASRFEEKPGETVEFILRTRNMADQNVPWFYWSESEPAGRPDDFTMQSFVMEYHPEFLASWYPDFNTNPSGISRTAILNRYSAILTDGNARQSDFLFKNVTGARLAVSREEMNYFRQELDVFGYIIDETENGFIASGPGINLEVTEKDSGFSRITRLDFNLFKPKEGQKVYTFGEMSVLTFHEITATWEF